MTYHLHISSFTTCNVIALLCYIITSLTGNFSQADELWSIVPAMYTWIMCVTDTRTCCLLGPFSLLLSLCPLFWTILVNSEDFRTTQMWTSESHAKYNTKSYRHNFSFIHYHLHPLSFIVGTFIQLRVEARSTTGCALYWRHLNDQSVSYSHIIQSLLALQCC